MDLPRRERQPERPSPKEGLETCAEMPAEQREAIVEEKSKLVEAAFARFLVWLAEP